MYSKKDLESHLHNSNCLIYAQKSLSKDDWLTDKDGEMHTHTHIHKHHYRNI